MSDIQFLLGIIARLADVMRRCDTEVTQENRATDGEWDAALNDAAQALLKFEGRPL